LALCLQPLSTCVYVCVDTRATGQCSTVC